jgi:hypothetical protein
MPPSLVFAPARDTLVDSIGILNILVSAHDQSFIDSVTILIQGAPLAFPAAHPGDTVFNGLFPVSLGPLRHRAFSFQVLAADELGHDVITQSVNVRLR